MTQTREQIEKKVIDIVADQMAMRPETITANTNLTELGGFDSLDAVEVLMELEEEFDVLIDDDEAQKALTIGEIVTMIERRLAEERK